MSTHLDCLNHVILDFEPHPEVTFVTQVDTHTPLFEDYMFSLGCEPWDAGRDMCECEQDWNCGCGRYGGATWLETRYDGMDD